ncbi:hypothetical protein HDU81_007479 [Chytriomyces hyalinus]|nr:hypothetical protein HDU81_007479 [Chytriomyces hyalinus]
MACAAKCPQPTADADVQAAQMVAVTCLSVAGATTTSTNTTGSSDDALQAVVKSVPPCLYSCLNISDNAAAAVVVGALCGILSSPASIIPCATNKCDSATIAGLSSLASSASSFQPVCDSLGISAGSVMSAGASLATAAASAASASASGSAGASASKAPGSSAAAAASSSSATGTASPKSDASALSAGIAAFVAPVVALFI